MFYLVFLCSTEKKLALDWALTSCLRKIFIKLLSYPSPRSLTTHHAPRTIIPMHTQSTLFVILSRTPMFFFQ